MLTSGKTLLDTVEKHARTAEQTGKKIWLTRHSLGGAVAQLVAAYLARVVDIDVHGLVTFGSPRVGDSGWVANFNTRLRGRHERWVIFGIAGP